eukprot:328625-Chlamydomonas_euryale.AAC.2
MLVHAHVRHVVVEELVAVSVKVHRPAVGRGRCECPLRDVQQVRVGGGVHAEVARVLLDLCRRWRLVDLRGEHDLWVVARDVGRRVGVWTAQRGVGLGW